MKIFISHRVQGQIDDLLEPGCEVVMNPHERSLTPDEAVPLMSDADGVLWAFGKLDKTLIDAAPRLRAICCYGAGSDHIDVKHATSQGIVVANLPDEVTDSTAELTWALLLAAARRIPEADRLVRSQEQFRPSLGLMVGTHLAGKQLGIVGMGRIGAAVAARAKAFGMSVAYHSRTRKPKYEAAYQMQAMDLPTLLATSDVLSLHVPLTEETRHLIGPAELARMKPDAILINAARGPIVDEQALIEALTHKRIRAAGLDVYEHEPQVPQALRELPNVVLSPHIGSATNETRCSMTRAAIRAIVAALNGQRPEHVVNPEVYTRSM